MIPYFRCICIINNIPFYRIF